MLDGRGAGAKRTAGASSVLLGELLEDRDCFDPLFFNISPLEAESMNRHRRLLLQEGWKALEDAGCNPKSLRENPVGIFIGAEKRVKPMALVDINRDERQPLSPLGERECPARIPAGMEVLEREQ